jgi:2-oxoglutarate dehydrogenase E1 component
VGICLQNKSRKRQKDFEPSLDISNFGLSSADLNTVFDAGKIVGKVPSTLTEIIAHLDAIYCQHIGVEYMYIRKPEFNGYKKSRTERQLPDFSIDQKKSILRKLNEAVSFENFCTKYVENVFTGRRRVNNSSS